MEPWAPDKFHAWVIAAGRDTPAWHAGHLILNLSGTGPWEPFDAIASVNTGDDPDKSLFATWVLSWK